MEIVVVLIKIVDQRDCIAISSIEKAVTFTDQICYEGICEEQRILQILASITKTDVTQNKVVVQEIEQKVLGN